MSHAHSDPAASAAKLDAYYELLGIPPTEQPPTHYRLLGLTPFEANLNVIERAADRQMLHLRSFQTGPLAEPSQKLLNEVAKARRLLLNAVEKSRYDAALQHQATAVTPQPARPTATAPARLPLNTGPSAARRTPRSSKLPIVVAAIACGAMVVVIALWRAMGDPAQTPVAAVPVPFDAPAVVSPPAIVPPPATVAAPKVVDQSPTTVAEEKPAEPAEEAFPEGPLVSVGEEAAFPVFASPPIFDEAAELRRQQDEIGRAREALRTSPKFQPLYEQLAANPAAVAANDKLAALLWAEVQENATIQEHLPSLIAALQEVERLASAGQNYRVALSAVEEHAKLAGGLTAAEALAAKGRVLAAAAATLGPMSSATQRTEMKDAVQGAMTAAIAADSVETVTMLVTADSQLMRSSIDRLEAIGRLVPPAREAMVDGRLNMAAHLLSHAERLLMQTTAAKQRKEVADALATLREQLTLLEEASTAQARLAVDPDDAAASTAMAKHLLINQGAFRESLPLFAKGNDAACKALATETISAARDGKTLAALADKWATVDQEPRSTPTIIARHLYAEALKDGSFTGLHRAAAETRARAIGPLESPGNIVLRPLTLAITETKTRLPRGMWVDLFPLIDFNADTVMGPWYRSKNRLAVADQTFSRLRLPALLANASYDFQLDFDATKDPDDLYAMLPVGDRSVGLVLDGYAQHDLSHFNYVNELDLPRNPIAIRGNLIEAKAYRLDVSVRLKGSNAYLVCALNGVKQFEYEGPIAKMSISPNWSAGEPARLGIGTYQSKMTFSAARLRLRQGEGYYDRASVAEPWPAEVNSRKPIWLTGLPRKVENVHHGLRISNGSEPYINGLPCDDFFYAHSPSSILFDIPEGARYFTGFTHCIRSVSVNFQVRIDGKIMSQSGRKAITAVCIEIPPGSKELELFTDPLNDSQWDHSSWCYPAFR